ncbi:MAG TPA: hypothetical protein VMH26_02105, partial [Burkholderiales bacterium]|nr:hypothetical protein [Burkholderiales bacterium]
AIWSETNANARVAELLGSQRKDFHPSAQANVDFPDDIDKATVRANALVTLQTVWQQGCMDRQDPSQSRRCRAAAFTAILQYGLSAGQDFDSAAPRFQSDFVSTFGRVWRQKWPQGLSAAQSHLPDRNPFGGTTSPYGGGGSGEVSFNWVAASDVSAQLDPLTPRPAREIWRFGGSMDSARFIAGWAKFFALADFRALDTQLLQQRESQRAPGSVYRAKCAVVRDSPATTGFKLQCASDDVAENGASLDARLSDVGSGRIDWLNLGPAGQLRDVLFDGGAARRTESEYVFRALPHTKKGLAARLPDGRALGSVAIRWSAGARQAQSSKPVEARFEAVVVDDFAFVRQAVDRLLAKQPALFDNVPLARANLMRALFSELGMRERSWCCIDDTDMPPAMLDPPEVSASAIEKRDWQPLFQYCAMCHLTREQFPPNFLSGDASRVADNLRQCAPRMLVRLSAWRAPVEQRVKSPMPPATAMPALGTTTSRWAGSAELELLRAYIEKLARREGQPSAVEELLKRGYEALPRCLPAAN